MTILIFVYLLLGAVLAVPFLWYLERLSPKGRRRAIANALVVAALIYVLFALFGGREWLAVESGGVVVYGVLAALGIFHSAYWLAVGWAAHPVWDVLLHLSGPVVDVAPEWYVIACVSFDLVVAGYVLYLQARRPAQRGSNES